eukprot:jgi/Ulvmu1/2008/UM012_0173.1
MSKYTTPRRSPAPRSVQIGQGSHTRGLLELDSSWRTPQPPVPRNAQDTPKLKMSSTGPRGVAHAAAVLLAACATLPGICVVARDQTCAKHAHAVLLSGIVDTPAAYTDLGCVNGPDNTVCDMIGQTGPCADWSQCEEIGVEYEDGCTAELAADSGCCLWRLTRTCPDCEPEVMSCSQVCLASAAAVPAPAEEEVVAEQAEGRPEVGAEASGAAVERRAWKLLGVCYTVIVGVCGALTAVMAAADVVGL